MKIYGSLFVVLLPALALCAAARADDTFSVTPEQEVTIGGGGGDTFGVESLSPADKTAIMLLRPKGESCTFRFPLSVGRSVELRSQDTDGRSLACRATLRAIDGDSRARFAADCTAAARSDERKCPPDTDMAKATSD